MKEKVFEILKIMLGEDATGIYCKDSVVEGMDNDDEFFSTVTKDNFGFLIEETDNYCLEHGCTRLVIIPKEEDFVIKLPITATYDTLHTVIFANKDDEDSTSLIKMWDLEYWDAEADDFREYTDLGYPLSEEESFHRIKHLSPICDLMDEENAYREDANEALYKILIPNEFIGYFNGIPVYIQKKIYETLSESCPYVRESKLSIKEKIIAENTMDKTDNHQLDLIFVNDCIKLYGEQNTKLILEGIKELAITDLHNNNIGYFKDGTIGIIDFAGYDDDIIWIYD